MSATAAANAQQKTITTSAALLNHYRNNSNEDEWIKVRLTTYQAAILNAKLSNISYNSQKGQKKLDQNGSYHLMLEPIDDI